MSTNFSGLQAGLLRQRVMGSTTVPYLRGCSRLALQGGARQPPEAIRTETFASEGREVEERQDFTVGSLRSRMNPRRPLSPIKRKQLIVPVGVSLSWSSLVIQNAKKRIVYLFGAGASHACVKWVNSPQGIQMRDLSLDLATKLRELVEKEYPGEILLRNLVNDVINEETGLRAHYHLPRRINFQLTQRVCKHPS